MPQPKTLLPDHLSTRPFSVAEARAAGLSAQALRHPRFERPFTGIRSLRTGPTLEKSPEQLARASALKYVPRLRPTEVLSHATALVLYGAPIRTDPAPHVSIAVPRNAVQARGVIGHTHSGSFTPWVQPETGALLMPPALAFAQAAKTLPFRELVVAADHLICPRQEPGGHPVLSLEELRGTLSAVGTRGVVRARAALEIARPGAESRMETLLRLLFVASGIDVFALQVDVYTRSGRWIGRFDMVDLERMLIVEYDGEQHRTSDVQYARDAVKLDTARDEGFRVLRFRHVDVLRRPNATVRRVAAALGLPLTPPEDPLASFLAER